jgi:hypothetical protein
MTTTIAYIFGILVLGIYIYVSFISRTISKKRYKYRIVFSFISLIIGLLVELINIFDKPFGFFIILGAGSFIYIFCYEIFQRLYRPWIGKYPYSPYREKIGNRPIEKGYPAGRIVTGNDYLFALTLFFAPFLIILLLMNLIK